MRRVLTILCAALLPGLMLLGCSSNHQKPGKPQLASPSTSPSGGPPAIPAEAKADTQAGAIAFARFWWDQAVAYGYAAMDSQQLRATSSAECRTCQNIINSLDTGRKNGERYTGGDITIIDAQSPTADAKQATVVVTYNLAAQQRHDKTGTVIQTWPASNGAALVMRLGWSDGQWTVTEGAPSS